ncbi:ubiquitin-conjugating enzyme E2 variant 1-like [Convolutriloba macropyga]|uniref:ubiquitin-conjugating enzyme E2 variant 1-like n=1 Tax=Convolutriloba macropyga TaxID=536237 RepID=UPI003F52899A
MAAPVVYPRSFKLLEEHEDSLKASESTISWGLADQDDMDMREWVATILGPPKSTFDSRIYTLHIKVSKDYPAVPPVMSFTTRVNCTCVDQKGRVIIDKVDVLKNWKPDYTIKKALESIRTIMGSKENAKLQQPPEGSPGYS